MSHHPSPPLTISHFLDLASPFSHALFQTSILLQTIDSDNNNTTTHIEPLPHLDYHLLYTLIHLARPHLSKRDLKRFDYLADARKFYYQCHHKFQTAFRTLLDLSSQSEQLDARHASLTQNLDLTQSHPPTNDQLNISTTLTSSLQHLSLLRHINERQTRTALADLKTRRERLERACTWFSSLKWKYLKSDIGALVEIGKQVYAIRNGKRRKCPSWVWFYKAREGKGEVYCRWMRADVVVVGTTKGGPLAGGMDGSVRGREEVLGEGGGGM